ncbi:MAG: hypothetical protein WCD07_10960, partial [Burkholderiales bacterium]
YEVVWLVFFSRYMALGVTFSDLIPREEIKNNLFYKSIASSTQKIFTDSNINLFKKPADCKGTSLAQHLAIFDKHS